MCRPPERYGKRSLGDCAPYATTITVAVFRARCVSSRRTFTAVCGVLAGARDRTPCGYAQPPVTGALVATSSVVPGRIPSASTSTAAITSADATKPDFIGTAIGAPGSGSRIYM